ncbi:MAG: hypothetical protein ACXIUD_05685, partial [Mongoliitalea sp.]
MKNKCVTKAKYTKKAEMKISAKWAQLGSPETSGQRPPTPMDRGSQKLLKLLLELKILNYWFLVIS